ncbi:hypothetical protein AALP_AA3G293700 [Arabis alpina]|uniref:Uncharacterized protein n=1 Tax=Arabis alpina TaxID=50452 RepID=A0A087HCH9_ARAAL|nr:hypothetical protein AALP_AA3G293700 [Arabis alpina]
MRGATPGIPAFNTPSIPIHPWKSRRLSEVSNRSEAEVTADPSAIEVIQDSEDNIEGVSLPNQEETSAVKDGSRTIPSATDAVDMQRADDAPARGSVPGEPKILAMLPVQRKGKVDPVDKTAEKERIAAKAKADLEAGRIPAFQIGGTCEVLPCSKVVNVPQLSLPRASLTPSSRPASKLSFEFSLSKRRCTTEVPRQGDPEFLGNSLVQVPPRHDNRCSFSHTDDELPLVSSDIKIGAELIRKTGGIGVKFPANLEELLVPDRFIDWSRDLLKIINSGSCIVSAYEAVVAEKEEQIKYLLASTYVDAAQKELDHQKARANSWERLEDEVKKRDVHLEVASNEIAELQASMKKSRLTEDRLRKERDRACHRADEITGGSSAQSARHSSSLERTRSLEKMADAEYELPPGLLENYDMEEEEYLAKVESLAADSLGDDILFPMLPPPLGCPPWDVSSQVPKGISEHRSFLSPQDNQVGDLV